jgi:hypothetical protein
VQKDSPDSAWKNKSQQDSASSHKEIALVAIDRHLVVVVVDDRLAEVVVAVVGGVEDETACQQQLSQDDDDKKLNPDMGRNRIRKQHS